MVSQGVSVINHSVGHFFDGPGDGTSPYSDSPLKTVDRAVNGSIIWVNAAGNSAEDTWFGAYSDPDGDGVISFATSDEGNTMLLEAGDIIQARLRWEGSWGGATRDFDLYIGDPATATFVGRSEDP